MIALSLHWRPEDQARLLVPRGRPGLLLGVQGTRLLAGGAVLALAGSLAGRLGAWAVIGPRDPAPLLLAPGWPDAAVAGGILGAALLAALVLRALERFALRSAFEARAAEGREPLVGPMAVTLDESRATFRAAAWEASLDTGLLSAAEETPEGFVLRFGPGRPVLLPRRDLSATEAEAVRDWAARAMARGRG